MIRVVFHTCGILHETLRIRIPIAQRSLYIHVHLPYTYGKRVLSLIYFVKVRYYVDPLSVILISIINPRPSESYARLVPVYQTFSIPIILLCNSRTLKPASVILYALFGSSYSNDPFSVSSFK